MPAALLLALVAAPPDAAAGPVHTDVLPVPGGYQLRRGGEPYDIRGAGGGGSLELLAACGANSNRAWSAGDYVADRLDEAHRRGLTVTVGLWLKHPRHGFDYGDAAATAKQRDETLAAVRRYKDHPALLMWGLGNEAEGFGDGDDPKYWRHVEGLAREIHRLDPHHPVMTVLAGAGGKKIRALHRLAPSVDVVGINQYGDAARLPQKYRRAGGRKPYVLTEYGPVGPWELEPNRLGAVEEPTSTEKSRRYGAAYRAAAADRACLGSYAFLWGDKIEVTTTWFGMLLPDGSRTAPVDVLTRLWGGTVADGVPTIRGLGVTGPETVGPGETVRANLLAGDPEGDPLTATWELRRDSGETSTGGDRRAAPPLVEGAISDADASGAAVTLPRLGGLYRVYAVVRDGHGGAATANVAVRVDAPGPGTPASLPLVVQRDDRRGSPFSPTAWMGNKSAVALDTGCRDDPHAGEHCVKVVYSAPDGWAAVAWRNPADSWGDVLGGLDLTGAGRLTVWARGDRGGERVKLGLGGVGEGKPYADTGEAVAEFTLTDEWKEYTIDLTAADLARIQTGLKWVVAGQGRPVTFYLDEPTIE